jgi:tetratricopeptide (TPR) repeat protein
MKRIIVCVIFCLFQYQAFACLNDYEPTINVFGNKVIWEEAAKANFSRSFYKENVLQRLDELEKELFKKYSYKAHSDYAVNLARIGKIQEALAILESLVKKYPNEYNIMANLGTVYELSGNPEKALEWIKKSVAKNPESHHGSEWVHIKILEAKLKIKENPKWLEKNSVLGLNIKQLQNEPFYDNTKKITNDLIYQLNERIPFTASPDEIVAQILMDLGELMNMYDVKESYYVFNYAAEYKVGDKALIQEKIKGLQEQILKLGLEVPSMDKMQIKGEVLQVADYQVKTFSTVTKNTEGNEVSNSPESVNQNWLYLVGGILVAVVALGLLFLRPKKRA